MPGVGDWIANKFAYVIATNVIRMQETNPMCSMYAMESVIVNEAIVANTTLYGPSSSGGSMAGFKDMDIQLYLVGGRTVAPVDLTATFTFEITNDVATGGIHPIWVDTTPSIYSQNLNSAGAVSYTSLGNTAFSDVFSVGNLGSGLYRFKITFDALPNAGNPAKVCLYTRRKAH